MNGCQTSHVLYECRKEFEPDQVLIPVKLVSTQDEEIVNAIIRSTRLPERSEARELRAMTRAPEACRSLLSDVLRHQSFVAQNSYPEQWVASKVGETGILTIS